MPTGTDFLTTVHLHNSSMRQSASAQSRHLEADQYHNRQRRHIKGRFTTTNDEQQQSTNNFVKRVHEADAIDDVIDDVVTKRKRLERTSSDVHSTRSADEVGHNSLNVEESCSTGDKSFDWTPMTLCVLPRYYIIHSCWAFFLQYIDT